MMLLIALLMLSQTQSGSSATPRKGTLPPGQGSGNMDAMQGADLTEEQKCQFDCAREQRNCTMPCAPKSAGDANDEKKRDEFMACSKNCMKKTQPCFTACNQKASKKDKEKGKPKPKTETTGGGGSP